MANNLIPEEVDALIQEYLTDGVLTDKERQVILRKAEGMGLNRDEIDLYLDAQVQKIDQATDAAVRRQKGKTCPYCGAPIPQLTDKCPECGQYITPEASDELKEIIDNLEDALVDLKSGKDFAKSKAVVERYVRKAELYFSNNPKIKLLLVEIEKEMIDVEKNIKSLSRKKTFKKLIPFVPAILCFVIAFSMYMSAYEELCSIPETHKTGFFEKLTPYERQSNRCWEIVFSGAFCTIGLICGGIWFNKKVNLDSQKG